MIFNQIIESDIFSFNYCSQIDLIKSFIDVEWYCMHLYAIDHNYSLIDGLITYVKCILKL